ncbi:hypothetical protein IWW37_001979 [Coemansia sp. RSA 2050]|nr:hypothetical protein IWW37_001979 [Coemansia sp. RSA 2050]KAJ2735460.1 hypothetical protein IW152_001532 [Coemansia sp. BCRC 34962]
MSSPDVWQQLHEFRLGGPLNQLVDFLVGLPSMWETSAAATVQEVTPSTTKATSTPVATTTTAPPNVSGQAAMTPTSEGLQLFGIFASRYFVCGLVFGYAISRIHMLVRRQRVRPVGALARVAIHAPAHALLLRALVRICAALDSNEAPAVRWMAGPVGHVAQEAQQWWGLGPVTAAQAVWEAFFASCIFDCIDVFVARLEGSPCAPYEYIGGVVERMSLYYFYGASVRIHELALLSVVEKLMLSHVLVAVPSGWQWRLLPTAAANMLLLHHFVFSMRHFSSSPQSMYPFVQVLSMALLAVSLAIVTVTVAVRWLAITVDRLGISSRPKRHASARPVAVYRNEEFQGINNDAEDDSLYELDQNTCLPLTPDLRRDFSVEILDMASTCLKQHSSNIRSGGFTRACGAMRRPRTTALDEYIDSVLQPSSRIDSGAVDALQPTKSARGMVVYLEDEPGIADMVPTSSMDLVTFLQDTRIDSICKLSTGLWALLVALFLYATKTKRGPPNLPRALPLRQNYRHSLGAFHASGSTPESSGGPGIREYASSDDYSDDEEDCDYVCMASATSDSSEDEDSFEDEDSEGSGELVNETATLMSEILSGDTQPAGGSNDNLAFAVAFIAHSVYGSGSAAMTRAMYARHVSRSEQIPQLLPFSRTDTESLAALIRSKRPAGTTEAASEDGVFCVVCWKSPRCVMLRPCRCLCLCNECRSALALRNFDHCPCCRRSVIGYSRVYAV